MSDVRALSPEEQGFLRGVLARVGRPDLVGRVAACMARPIADGSSGASLELGTQSQLAQGRSQRGPAKQVGTYGFTDLDGGPVDVAVNVDASGALFELDILKFYPGPLVALPDDLDAAAGGFRDVGSGR